MGFVLVKTTKARTFMFLKIQLALLIYFVSVQTSNNCLVIVFFIHVHFSRRQMNHSNSLWLLTNL